MFRAHHLGLGADVAIKVLLPHVFSRADLVERFEFELRVARELRHPNTIRVLDFSRTAHGLPFIAMEFLEGRTLASVLESEGRISPERTRHVAIQVLKSLGEAHAKGVVHRDLKPGNIMLCDVHGEPDFVKVLDFGIAKAVTSQPGSTTLTDTGAILGTPNYMSPEQVYGLRTLDGRTDLYALGLIMAECLVGRALVEAETPMAVLQRHIDALPHELPDALTHTPLDRAICRAVAKSSDDRYPDAESFRAALEAIGPLDGELLPAAASATDQAAPSTPPSHGWPPTANDGESLGTVRTSGGWLATLDTQPGLASTVAAEGAPSHERAPVERRSLPTSAPFSLALALAAVLGAAVAVIGVGGANGDVSHAEPRVESYEEAPSPTTAAELSAPADLADPPPVADHPAPVTLEETKVAAWHERETDLAIGATFALAAERLRDAIPTTHLVRFSGTPGARVGRGGVTWGVVPFEVVLPRVTRTLELEVTRDGFRDAMVALDLTSAAASIELRRRRDRQRDSETTDPDAIEAEPPGASESGAEGEPPPAFGTIPIRP